MRLAVRALSAVTLTWSAYLLTLLAAAAAGRARPARRAEAPTWSPATCVLVPAHDEEAGLPATLASLLALEGLASPRDIVVVADNCSDATAEVARAAGVTVLERHAPRDPGKGQAVAWALERILDGPSPPDHVLMVDADCTISPGALQQLRRALIEGADAAQAAYVVANADAAPSAALRAAAFSLMNVVRPAGKSALGLSAGLYGTGMAFTADTLRAVPWRAFGVAEDAEYHLRLVAAGRSVAFVEDGVVSSPMPTSFAASQSQQTRWEGGRTALIRTWVPRLLAVAARRRDPEALHAAAELLTPALSLQVAAQGVALVAALGTRDRRAVAVPAAALAGTGVYVIGGLRYVRAPRAVWRALLRAPLLVAQKLGIVAGLARSGGPPSWERTEREPGTT
jgi:hypothetical protein